MAWTCQHDAADDAAGGNAAGSSALKQSSPHSLQMLWARCGFGGGVPALPGGPCMELRCLSGHKPLIKANVLNHGSSQDLRGASAWKSCWAHLQSTRCFWVFSLGSGYWSLARWNNFPRIVLSASGCSMKLFCCPGLEQSKKARRKVAEGLGKLVSLRPGMPVCPGWLGVLLWAGTPRAGLAANISIQTNWLCLFLLALLLSPLCSRKGEFTLWKCRAYMQFSWSSDSQPNQQEHFGNDRSQLRSVLIW